MSLFSQCLKYKIFEWCLETLFDKLHVNFQTADKILHGLYIGKKYSRIEHIFIDTINEHEDVEKLHIYFDVEITAISKENQWVGFRYKYVYLKADDGTTKCYPYCGFDARAFLYELNFIDPI